MKNTQKKIEKIRNIQKNIEKVNYFRTPPPPGLQCSRPWEPSQGIGPEVHGQAQTRPGAEPESRIPLTAITPISLEVLGQAQTSPGAEPESRLPPTQIILVYKVRAATDSGAADPGFGPAPHHPRGLIILYTLGRGSQISVGTGRPQNQETKI